MRGTDLKDLGDKKLWGKYLSGDKEALSELFLRYYKPLFNYGMNLIYEEELVKDGIQKLFFRFWKNREEISHVDSPKFYSLISLKNILLRKKESINSQEERNREYVREHQYLSINIEQELLDDEMERERYQLFKKAISQLTNRQRQVINLRLNYGLKNEEIAQLIDISHQAVRNIIYNSTKRMKKIIVDYSDV